MPLCILCSEEHACLPPGAQGIPRRLTEDAGAAPFCRRAPSLGSAQPAAFQYVAWCRALLRGEAPAIGQPGAQGVFLHPLDAAAGSLYLGAQRLEGNDCAEACRLDAAAQNLCVNRSACLHLIKQAGLSLAPKEEVFPGAPPATSPPCGHLPLLSDFSPVLGAKEALSFLMAYERALAENESAADQVRLTQAEQYLARLT